jgi:hypothetical protein
LEADLLDVSRVRFRYAYPLAEMLRQIRQDGESVDFSQERLLVMLSDPALEGAKIRDLWDAPQIVSLVTLLRYFRPGFDALNEPERAALVEAATEKTNAYLEALRSLMIFLMHGDAYSGNPTRPVTEAARQVRAAELRDIDGLTNATVGERLGIPPTESDKIKGDNSRARNNIRAGRRIFERALGKEGCEAYVGSHRADAETWRV